MAIHLIANILLAAVSVASFFGLAFFWIWKPNKNNRKDLTGAALGISLVLAIQALYFLTSNHEYERHDHLKVNWQLPVFTGVEGIFLILAIALFLAVDFAMIILMMIKAAAIAFAWTVGVISGDEHNEGRTHAYWFIIALGLTFCLFVLGILAHKRDKDKLGWLVLVWSFIFVSLFGIGWFCGPTYNHYFSGAVENWFDFVAAIFLFILLPMLMVLLQGEDNSVLNKIRAKLSRKSNSPEEKEALLAGNGQTQ